MTHEQRQIRANRALDELHEENMRLLRWLQQWNWTTNFCPGCGAPGALVKANPLFLRPLNGK